MERGKNLKLGTENNENFAHILQHFFCWTLCQGKVIFITINLYHLRNTHFVKTRMVEPGSSYQIYSNIFIRQVIIISFYLPPADRPGTGDYKMPDVRACVRPSVRLSVRSSRFIKGFITPLFMNINSPNLHKRFMSTKACLS